MFHLVQPGEEEEQEITSSFGTSVPFDRLRQQAIEASPQAQQSQPREAKSLYYKRSAIVRKYVLVRAEVVCESCGNLAPFLRKDGSPYLEPHHTRRVFDGGPIIRGGSQQSAQTATGRSTTGKMGKRRTNAFNNI